MNKHILELLASKTKLSIDFGGGIKTDDDIQAVFNAGAAIATVGSIAVKNKGLFLSWLKTYGADKLLLGADVKAEKITIAGWLEGTDVSVFDFLKDYQEAGIKQVFCTDVAKDGLLEGPATDLYKKILAQVPGIHLIASGGVSCMKDLNDLREAGCSGVIIGKAIYENRISVKELTDYLKTNYVSR